MMLVEKMKRAIFDEFKKFVRPQKVLILLGARRVGKTSLIKEYLKELDPKEYLLLNGEDQLALDLLAERSIINYKRLIGNQKILVIDEAQKIPEIGLKLKLMVDEIEGLSIIVTGSSVFDLRNKLGEPLVGRENTLRLYPLAQVELAQNENFLDTKQKLEERLIFGGYPELEQYPDWEEKINYLERIE